MWANCLLGEITRARTVLAMSTGNDPAVSPQTPLAVGVAGLAERMPRLALI